MASGTDRGGPMGPVWRCVRAGLRQDWRGLAVLTLITALMGAVALTALAGARRTETAVPRFLQYAGPFDGQVSADIAPAAMARIAALPEVAYSSYGALMLTVPTAIDGRAGAGRPQAEVITQAQVTRPPQVRAIVIAGRYPAQSQAGEVMVTEAAARDLRVHVGSVIRMAGYRPSQIAQVMNGSVIPPGVPAGTVRVTGIVRTPTDLTDNLDAPSDVTYTGQGAIIATAAFFDRYAGTIGHFAGLSFRLRNGPGELEAFQAGVRRLAGPRAQIELGSDAVTAGAAAQRGTSLEAVALALFGGVMALALLVVIGQSLARQAQAAAGEFPALRSLGAAPRQLAAIALAPGAAVAVAGMTLAIPAAYGLSVLTPIGLARRAEVSPGPSFDAAIMLGGAGILMLLLAGRAAVAAVAAPRAARAASGWAAARPRPGMAGWLTGRGLSPAAATGVRMAFGPGHAAVPVRPAIAGMTAALAAVAATLVFGASLSHAVGDPAVTGWNWNLAVGNPHSGDVSAQAVPRLRADRFVAGITVTAMGGALLDGHDVTLVGVRPVTGQVLPPVVSGRLPDAPREIALAGRDLRALHQRVGGQTVARTARGPVPLRIVGQVVLSPEIANEQIPLGSGGVMTLGGAAAVSQLPMPRNVFLIALREPGDQAGVASLKRQFPGTVLPAVPPPEVRNLSAVSGLPLTLALLLALLAAAFIAHALVTSVRRRRRELAILKTVGFTGRQVRAAVAWQATAIAGVSVAAGLPLGLAAGRWAWNLFADQTAIVPAPVLSPLTLLTIPAVLLLANVIAVVPARAAARAQPAMILKSE